VIAFQSLSRAALAELLRPLEADTKFSSALGSEDLEKKRALRAEYRAKMIFRWVYQRFVTDWDQMSDLSKDLRAWLKDHVVFYSPREKTIQRSRDGTWKVLWTMEDGKSIESVVIPSDSSSEGEEADEPASTRMTACISSQVGCAMGCQFCLTGTQGLERNLQAHEIVGQVLELRRRTPITNIVFMGMGEPLHNLENVITACEILLDEYGFNFSKRRVTVSTSGLVPAIEELSRRIDVSLAISLNANTDEIRNRIMPVNRKWNIASLMAACRKLPLHPHRRVTFEYVLLKGKNDSLEDAARLVQLVKGMHCKINLISYNPHPESQFERPETDVVQQFQKYLLDRGLTTLLRVSRGQDILAACGQLRSEMAKRL